VRRPPTIRLEPLAEAVAARTDHDEVTEAILDAAVAVLAEGGLRRFTVEEIAAAGRLGRTTIYRRFEGRDALVHAALGRELQRTFAAIAAEVADRPTLEDRVVDGILAGLRAARESLVIRLVRQEPELLRLVTVDGGPLIVLATDLLVAAAVEEAARTDDPDAVRPDGEEARHLAEVLIRLATSLALAPQSTLPLDDDTAARAALHRLLDPLLRR